MHAHHTISHVILRIYFISLTLISGSISVSAIVSNDDAEVNNTEVNDADEINQQSYETILNKDDVVGDGAHLRAVNARYECLYNSSVVAYLRTYIYPALLAMMMLKLKLMMLMRSISKVTRPSSIKMM